MLRETITIYWENLTEHMWTMWAEPRIFNVKHGGTKRNGGWL